jgi:hypothetical protein
MKLEGMSGRSDSMGDLIFIALVLAFFGVSFWFIEVCDRLRRQFYELAVSHLGGARAAAAHLSVLGSSETGGFGMILGHENKGGRWTTFPNRTGPLSVPT